LFPVEAAEFPVELTAGLSASPGVAAARGWQRRTATGAAIRAALGATLRFNIDFNVLPQNNSVAQSRKPLLPFYCIRIYQEDPLFDI
jgi:hypothetical protein